MASRSWVLAYVLPALAIAVGLATSQERPEGASDFRLAEYHFDADRAWAMLEKLVALGPRYEHEPREAAKRLIVDDARSWGATSVGTDVFTTERYSGANVVAEYAAPPGPTGETLPAIVVL